MKIPLTYAGLCAIGGAILTLLLYFGGFHESVEKLPVAQWVGGIGGILILVIALALAMREKRSQTPADASWGYGSAFGTGALTAVLAAVFGAIFYFAYASYINPAFTDVVREAQQAQLTAMNLPAEQLAQREKAVAFMSAPGVSAAVQGVFGAIFSVLIALVVAIFFRQPLRRETAASIGV
jgi:hypothetical protein